MSRGPQAGLGLLGTSSAPANVAALSAQVGSLLAKVNGAVDKLDVTGTTLTFTTVDGRTHTEQLPDGGTPFTLTADGVTKALNQGEAPDSGTLSGLASGWWYVPAAATAPNLKGRPADMTGSGILFKMLTQDSKGVMMLYSQNAKLQDTMWLRFKLGTTWGAWVEYPNIASLLSGLSQAVAAVQHQQLVDKAALDNVSQLVTDVAANRAAIATMQTSRIPTMDEIKAHLESLGWGAQTAHLTIEQVKAALTTAGWGPTPPSLTVEDVQKALEKLGWGPDSAAVS